MVICQLTYYCFLLDNGTNPAFVTTYGPDRNVSFDATFDSINEVSPDYNGYTPVFNLIQI
jgi:hypothetical protein